MDNETMRTLLGVAALIALFVVFVLVADAVATRRRRDRILNAQHPSIGAHRAEAESKFSDR